jgi:hypothetical protein
VPPAGGSAGGQAGSAGGGAGAAGESTTGSGPGGASIEDASSQPDGIGGEDDVADGSDGGEAASSLDDTTDSVRTPSDVAMESDANSIADSGCVGETASAFCQRIGKNCGVVVGTNNCGNPTTANCGSCPPLLTCGGGGQLAVCGALPNLAQGGTVTSSNPNVSPEDMTKAFDNSSSTKWYATVTTAWIAYQFAGTTTHKVTSYAITSANDVPTRDPSAWQFQGSNDGTTWTTLDTRTAQVFTNRFQTNGYTCANNTAYTSYRLNITANSGATSVQLAEIQLFGN